ncbi:hypothetical protein BRADI_3g33994v3 [Brachypodium distachyon]|uniref:Uncharacterized protein n=1 Tax=Brachypodium distachyon TaxID=15368 RepID=A0A0Q3M067_BRADI|nr:hypothetical protein BRADI_3g33994v3 [Brachypodium distachyon]
MSNSCATPQAILDLATATEKQAPTTTLSGKPSQLGCEPNIDSGWRTTKPKRPLRRLFLPLRAALWPRYHVLCISFRCFWLLIVRVRH